MPAGPLCRKLSYCSYGFRTESDVCMDYESRSSDELPTAGQSPVRGDASCILAPPCETHRATASSIAWDGQVPSDRLV